MQDQPRAGEGGQEEVVSTQQEVKLMSTVYVPAHHWTQPGWVSDVQSLKRLVLINSLLIWARPPPRTGRVNTAVHAEVEPFFHWIMETSCSSDKVTSSPLFPHKPRPSQLCCGSTAQSTTPVLSTQNLTALSTQTSAPVSWSVHASVRLLNATRRRLVKEKKGVTGHSSHVSDARFLYPWQWPPGRKAAGLFWHWV